MFNFESFFYSFTHTKSSMSVHNQGLAQKYRGIFPVRQNDDDDDEIGKRTGLHIF